MIYTHARSRGKRGVGSLRDACFQGSGSGALTAWLRQSLAGNLADLARHHSAGKRDVRLEQSLHQAVEESSIRLEGCLKDNDPTPPEQIEHNEQVLLLIEALEHFPEDQRNDPTDH